MIDVYAAADTSADPHALASKSRTARSSRSLTTSSDAAIAIIVESSRICADLTGRPMP